MPPVQEDRLPALHGMLILMRCPLGCHRRMGEEEGKEEGEEKEEWELMLVVFQPRLSEINWFQKPLGLVMRKDIPPNWQ